MGDFFVGVFVGVFDGVFFGVDAGLDDAELDLLLEGLSFNFPLVTVFLVNNRIQSSRHFF